ncbi:formin-like protein 8 [Salvia miltiorrhiza]|uniref:formin-like protein 8 n=1 Tax=Salvia miltiorrhiza TaxID=226208 RepID=UPI0025AC1C5E|nr:formin-like protein 8 [Salvia miltiorrhiza]
MAAHSRTIIQIVAITATVSLIVTGIIFYLIHRLRLARREKHGGKPDASSFRREFPTAAPRVEFRQRGAALKGVIVDEEGKDVLYLRKLESGCFSKVWYNPMVEEEEEVKRMNIKEEKPKPIQQLPLLQHPRNHPPSPPPTPSHQAPLPPPPPPPPLPSRPAPPPLPPPQPAKRLIPSHKPPIAPRIQENRESRVEEKRVHTAKLKPLHWDKVTANTDHSMVWNEINDGSLRFDDELMEALFGYTNTDQKSNGKGKNSSSIAAPSPQIFILDPRKSQNAAIIIKSLQTPRKEIIDAAMEGRGLNAETLEKLTKICPTQEETTRILQFSGDPAGLAAAEAFLHHILRAIPSAFVRFNAMLFRESYEPEMLHLKESLQICELACSELRSGGVFFKLLEAILKAGNRLNAGTNWGNAQGFNLTALRRLSDVKSADGKTTLLHFVVEQVVRSEGKRRGEEREMEERESVMLGLPAVESLSAEFCNVKRAARVDYEGLIGTCEVLAAKVDEIKRVIRRADGSGMGRFAAEMRRFLEACEEEVSVVREEERRVIELVRKTNVYYQTGVKGGNPLQLFVMVKDFLENVDRVCGEISRKLERRRGGASPPLSPTPRSPVRFQNLQSYFVTQRVGASSSESDDDF